MSNRTPVTPFYSPSLNANDEPASIHASAMNVDAPLKRKGKRVSFLDLDEDENAIMWGDPETPGRVVALFHVQKQRFAIKIFPQYKVRFLREYGTYHQLSQPMDKSHPYAFDPNQTVRLVYGNRTTIDTHAETKSLEFPFFYKSKPYAVRFDPRESQRIRNMFSYRAEMDEYDSNTVPVVYMVTEAPEAFDTVERWHTQAKTLPRPVRKMFLEKMFCVFAPTLLRAHMTYQFGHFDLHMRNMLCKISYDGKTLYAGSELPRTETEMKRVRVVPKLFDFDLSISDAPRIPPVPNALRRYVDPKYLHLWYYAGLGMETGQAEHANEWRRYGPVHDLSRIFVYMLDRNDSEQLNRIRTSLMRRFSKVSESIGRLWDSIAYVGRKHDKSNIIYDARDTIRGLKRVGLEPPVLYPWKKALEYTNSLGRGKHGTP